MMVKQYMALFGLLLLTGCISLIPKAGSGPDIFRLSPVVATGHGDAVSKLILLPRVSAPKELKNNRVALVRGAQSISYAANARWASSTPEMLQDFFANAFREQGGVRVVHPSDGVVANWEVRVHLQNFEADYDQGTEMAALGIVAVRVQFVDRKTRQLLAEKHFRATDRAKDLRLSSIVAAIDQATHEVALQMVTWVAKQGVAGPLNE